MSVTLQVTHSTLTDFRSEKFFPLDLTIGALKQKVRNEYDATCLLHINFREREICFHFQTALFCRENLPAKISSL
jgi:hypothetical protein